MSRSVMPRLRALWRQLRPGDLLALGVLAVALLAWAWGWQGARRAQRAIEAQTQVQQARPQPAKAQETAAPAVPARSAWQQVQAVLPPWQQNAQDLRQVFALAKRHRIDLPKAQYEFHQEPRWPWTQVTVVLTAKADYRQAKGFAADLLRALPHAALDDLGLQRPEDTAGPALDMRLRLTLNYLRPSQPKP
jgi:hypothetical protein